MKVKEIERTANVSWSPAAQHPVLLAAGTAAQQLDASFSTTAALEIYSLNLTEPGLDMELRTSLPSDYRFHKIAWGCYGFGKEYGNGIIVGGCDGGCIQVYNAAKVLAGEEGLVARRDKHTGPVRALDFNPYQANLLASGASESEILIWDLNSTDTPMLPGAKSQPTDDVLSISWNRQVQHILASTFAPRCVVWDLRKNEPIIKLTDSTSRIRWKVVAWHPEVATQLCLASEEDQSPVIQLWDLRFATSPLKVLENHQRGVLSIAWCRQDPDLLVSCGKDNRILCWNPNSSVPGGEVVCDLATANQWNFDVSWCPRNPALIASCSFDGHVSVYSLTGGQQQVQTSNKIADSFPGMDAYVQAPVPQQQQQSPVDLRKPPKWLRRPVGVSFGFGGKLVSFTNEAIRAGQTGVMHAVYVSQVVTEPGLIARSNQFESALQYGKYADFCQVKILSSTVPHERSLWNFLRASFETNTRAELLSLLGFKPDEINSKLGRYIGKPANAGPAGDVDGLSDRVGALGRDLPDGDASAAFDMIAAASSLHTNKVAEIPADPFKISIADDAEGLICQALLLGNTEAAVELCLQNGRMADAIILAMTGGSDLLAKTQYRYFQQTNGYLSTIISAVVTEDWSQVIRACEVESWKEALAAVLTYTRNEEFPALCELLGERLEAEGKGTLSLNAQLCYICAGNLNKLVESWTAAEKIDTPAKLQDLVELVVLLRKTVEQQGRTVEVSGKLAEVLSHYAAVLASQGNTTTALTYLQNSEDEQMVLLRDRLYRALGLGPAYQQQPQPQQQQQQQRAVSHSFGRLPAVTQQPTFSSQQQSSVLYGQKYSAPAVQSSLFPAQQPQTAAKPFNSPTVPNFYPANSVAKPSTPQQFTQTVVPPKPFSPAPPSSAASQTHDGFGNPSQLSAQAVSGALNQSGSTSSYARSYSPLKQDVYENAWESAQIRDNSSNFLRWSGGSATSRKPYLRDPSVQTGPQYGGTGSMYPGGFNATPVPNNPAVPSYPNQPANTLYPAADIYNPADNVNAQPSGVTPGVPPVNTPPGWNDPPILRDSSRIQAVRSEPIVEMSAEHAGTRKWKSIIFKKPKADSLPQNPITHPLYGAVPQESAPPMVQNMAVNGGYVDPLVGAPYQPQQSYLQHQAYPQQQQQQQQQQHLSPVAPAKVAEPPKPKGPIPEEHMYLQTVFEELRNRCSCTTNSAQLKRKLEDVSRKLEILYDALRESKLSPSTLQGLHQIVQMVQIGDYTGGLALHTQLVSGSDFSQIANFMPGLKVLLQSAMLLQVYLQ
ncbi:protein transport protein Sec31A isoform X3 [Zootermopsis nevadensis]|uniref:protein transport protein Sec31A isoform X3 n=1 Tax=Zootermopsis nevadensis TaxID=136037 RepID=UPI000B8ED81A|nr:protein transport protein Sec31A isoform X3 [Zootermopsis nevadensis]